MASVYLIIYSQFLVFHCSFSSCCSEVFLCSPECAHLMCGITLLWRLLLILHFSPRRFWLPERAVCSKTCREQPFLTPFPNVTIQRFPVHTPEKKSSPFFSEPGHECSLAGPRQSRTVTFSKTQLTEKGSTAHRAGVTL